MPVEFNKDPGPLVSLPRPGVQTEPEFEPANLQARAPRTPVTATDQLTAAFQLENVVASIARRVAEPGVDRGTEEFDPLEHLLPGEEVMASEFADANSQQEMALIRKRIEHETRARMLIETGPVNSFLANTIAVMSDPTSYLPLGGAAIKGGSFSARMARAGAIGAAEVAATESLLQATQQTRTLEESLSAIVLGGAFGMGLGGLGGAIAARGERKLMEDAVRDFTAVAESQFPGESTVGAAAAPSRLAPEDTELAGGRVTQALARTTAQLKKVGLAAPSLELSTSQFARSRELVNTLVDTGLVTKGQARGLAGPVSLETKIKRHDAVIGNVYQSLRELHRQHRKAGGQLGRVDFFNQVGRAMRRGDMHDIPEVQTAAQTMRAQVFDPYKDAAVRAGLLPEDVDVSTATSYFSRVYNRDKIMAMRPEFRARITRYLASVVDPADLPAGEQELDVVADGIIDTILGSPSGRVPLFNMPEQRGPLKERTFNIPDDVIEDFLEDNAVEVLARYVRTMAADTEFANQFGGKLDLEDELSRLRDDVTEAQNAAKTAKERKAIADAGRREAAVLETMARRIRGISDEPINPAFQGLVRVGRAARNLNFVRLLGSVLISSIPDVAQPVLKEGFGRAFGTLISEMGRGFKGIKMGIREAQLSGTALDLVMSQRSAAVFDLGERFAAESKFERVLNVGAQQFGNLTLLNYWNTAMKGWVSTIAATRILKTSRALAEGKKVSKGDMRRLATSNIDEAMARRIAAQAEHWDDLGQVVTANTAAWTDHGAVEAMRNALLRDVDNTIITPGVGDAPLWTGREMGKTIFQFKKFGFASTQRIMLAVAQGMSMRDAAALNGLVLMLAMGAASTALRDLASKGEVKERDGAQWTVDAIDRSGMISVAMEMDAVMERNLGMSPTRALTGAGVSRFAGRGGIEQILGPSAGLAGDIGSASASALRGEFTQPDLHKIRKLFPGQNLFYIRYLLDQAEKATGLPEREPRK